MGHAASVARLSLAAVALTALASAGCSLPTAVLGAADTGDGTMDAGGGGTDAGTPVDSGRDAFVAADDTGVDAYVAPDDAYTPADAYAAPDAYVAPDAYAAPDAYVAPDAYAPPDAYVAPDAYAPPDAYTPPDCDTSYGSVSGYRSCPGTSAGTCVFYMNWAGSSTNNCASVCGARCVSAIGNADFTMCTTSGSSFPCTQSFQDAICTCTP